MALPGRRRAIVKPKTMIAAGSGGAGALAIATTEPGAVVVLAIVLGAAIVGAVICWAVSDDGKRSAAKPHTVRDPIPARLERVGV